jgi:hypothetical protein
MRGPRSVAAGLAVAVVMAGTALVAPPPAFADGLTSVPITCTGIPLVGTLKSTADVTATDDVDPVAPGGAVLDTIHVPVPVGSIPITVTVQEVKLTVAIPSGVTVNNVTFTSSSFTGTSWVVSGTNLIATLTGSVPVGGGAPAPNVPDVKVATTVAGPPRTIAWKVPSLITAKADAGAFGTVNASCTPDDPTTTLITTTVAVPNTAPTATDQSVDVGYQTAKAITLTGTDPESNPLTFALGATAPAHGLLTGTPPNLTYTPNAGYSGPDSFTFTASDGLLSDIGTVSITVAPSGNHAPTATDQAVSVPFGTAKPITLAGTDPDANPLTFALGATAPAHGLLTGTPPNLTYTPTAGYLGADSFTFTASDSLLSDVGTVTINVVPAVPGVPTGVAATGVKEGRLTLGWTPPTYTGGSALTGFSIVPIANGVPQAAIPVVGGGSTSQLITGLSNGVPYRFTVAAVNAVGTGLPSALSATATPKWWLPWSSGTAAVTQLFTWFTGKAPTATELSPWLSQMDGGTKLPGDLVAALRAGPDATSSVDPTTRLYSAYFLRIPDKGGLTYWIKKKRAGTKISTISQGFATSHEFVTRYGTMTNRKFVEQIYLNVQGRAGEKSGVDYWTGQLDAHKKNRGQVMVGFSESSEYKRKTVNQVHAAILSIDLDNRAPTVAQRDALVAAIVAGGVPQTVRDLIHDDATLAARVS